jgi:sterol carrier protein 2
MVKNTQYCLQHNLGLGGAAIVTVYKRADGKNAPVVSDQQVGKLNGLGYNPATEAKGFTTEQARRTVSQKKFSEWALQDTQVKVQSRF